jgi:hypothetical protein
MTAATMTAATMTAATMTAATMTAATSGSRSTMTLIAGHRTRPEAGRGGRPPTGGPCATGLFVTRTSLSGMGESC